MFKFTKLIFSKLKYFLFLIFTLFINSFFLYATQTEDKEIRFKIEDFILEQNKDSASFYLNKFKDSNNILPLKQLIESDFTSISANKYFIDNVSDRYSNNYMIISNYINRNVKEPKGNLINMDYVLIRWKQYSYLIDDRFLDESYSIYKNLQNYLSRFDAKNKNVANALLRVNTYPLTIHVIKKEIEKGKQLALNSIEKAKELNDLELQVIFYRNMLYFYVLERDLKSYIETGEKALKIAETLENKEQLYKLIPDLVNAYIFKGGYTNQCLDLLQRLQENNNTRSISYTYYIQFIYSNKNNEQLITDLLGKFKVSTVLELVKKLKPICKSNLVDNEYVKFLSQSSRALLIYEYYTEAFSLKNEIINLTRDIYSNKLSESLATYKAEQSLNEKEIEVKNEREKAKLYLIIAILCGILLVVSFFVIRKIKKQSTLLTKQNTIINESLNEKELLIKETHHRVKNNFQIITSLLDLQNEEIQDKNTLNILNKGKNRVKSMALVHQKLYQNKSGLIDIRDLIESLFKEISEIYKLNKKVVLKTDINEFLFDVDTANPLALILNEVFTNSFKYAFTEDAENELYISLTKDDNENFILVVKDNGKSNVENINFENSTSFGLKLVKRLAKQLHGSFKILRTENGVTVEINFKDTQTRKQQT